MDYQAILEIVVVLGFIGGISYTVYTIKKKKKDSSRIHNLNQQAISNGNTYQSGRDINVK